MLRGGTLTLLCLLMLGCGSPATTDGDGSVSGGSYLCSWSSEYRRICPDSTFNRHTYAPGCEMVASPSVNCFDVLPPDEDWRTISGGCEEMTNYSVSEVHTLAEPVPGACEDWRLWATGVIQCFNDANCPENQTCVDDVCHCGDTPLPQEVAYAQRCEGELPIHDHSTCTADRTVETTREPSTVCDTSEGLHCVVNDVGNSYCDVSP